ncbi:hypothetical protein EG68_11572 [Paragonimus skrjabini miyazakii]|uniref:Uncharacterized protein n=1 Tax=Paragonimus skrjabini miyazakii TaxID=59628 RepID=A0A8S9YPN6_9TREM|nr:hypothetical protein EG68_11572 [Paragonimus skrjabini miyazakii]
MRMRYLSNFTAVYSLGFIVRHDNDMWSDHNSGNCFRNGAFTGLAQASMPTCAGKLSRFFELLDAASEASVVVWNIVRLSSLFSAWLLGYHLKDDAIYNCPLFI